MRGQSGWREVGGPDDVSGQMGDFEEARSRVSDGRSPVTDTGPGSSVELLLVLLQESQTKIRIHGSRKKGSIIQSDLVASNGVIHLIDKLMDSVSPSVQSNKDVRPFNVSTETEPSIPSWSCG